MEINQFNLGKKLQDLEEEVHQAEHALDALFDRLHKDVEDLQQRVAVLENRSLFSRLFGRKH